MTHPRDAFDAALIPGMRDQLRDAYTQYRAAEARFMQDLAPAGSLGTYRVRDCPLCGAPSANQPAVLHAHGLDLLECAGCGLTYTRQVMDESDDSARYAASSLDAATIALHMSPPYLALETARARYYIDRIQAHTPRGALLEIGCGTGTFVLEAAASGWNALGIEPGHSAAETAAERGAPVVCGWFPADMPPHSGPFQVIALPDVLEHFADPLGFLETARRHLQPGGLMFVQVPNWDSLLIRLQGAASSTVCPGHWSYFTPDSLTCLMQRAGFRPILTETVISELDRIAAFPQEDILHWLHRLRPQASPHPPDAASLHDMRLGYKLIGLFQAQ